MAMQDTVNAIEAAAAALSQAIEGRTRLTALPGPGPASETQAYAVQDAIILAIGTRGGWKVSPLREGKARCSPIPASFFMDAPTQFDAAFLDGCLAEVEIAVRFKADPLGQGRVLSPANLAECIASVHPAVELLSSRFAAPDGAPDLHRLADLQGCIAVILGAPVTDWPGLEFAELPFGLMLAGQEVSLKVNSPTTEQTLEALCWLADHAASRDTPIEAGNVVITGARLGPVSLQGVGDCHARIGALGPVALSAR
jgi:2-keto-4-pentenoate hydratase